MSGKHERQHGSVIAVVVLVGAYAVIHSFFASRGAKNMAARLVGTRVRDGLYRGFYIVQASITTTVALRIFLRLPDHPLYKARSPWSYMLAGIQIAGLALLAKAVSTIGFKWLVGLENAAALLRGDDPPRMPEAQGPRQTSDGRIDAQGPFRYIRHPDNLPIIVVLWAFPRMTVNRLTLAVLSSVYALIGSWHEDRRLRAAYGKAFEDYCRAVPMMIPKLSGRSCTHTRVANEGGTVSSDESALLAGVELRHEWVRGDGVNLHVARAGEGPPVILLHGFPENWRSWRHQIAVLVAAGFSVWAADLRGYNLSDRPSVREAYHLRHLIEDVAALVRATGQSGAHIIGHDWGGVIAWTFAGVHPELTRKLVILNAPHMRIYLERVRQPSQMFRSWYVLFFQLRWFAERALSANHFQAVRGMFRHTPAAKDTFSREEIECYIESLSKPGALTAALNYYRANIRPDALRLASSAQISAATLVIWGEMDPALSLTLLSGLEQVAPRVRVHRIARAGHWVQNEAPAEVNDVILRFLKA